MATRKRRVRQNDSDKEMYLYAWGVLAGSGERIHYAFSSTARGLRQ